MTLSRAGDFLYDGFADYIKEMEVWFRAEHLSAYQTAVLPDGRWRLCMGVIVYGSYVDRFLRLCVPSLLAKGNIRSLIDPLVIVHTDSASENRIKGGLYALRQHARVEVHVMPDHIVAMVADNPANKYWLLGAAGHLHMQQAKYRGHAYHMLMPDHVYGEGFFLNLQRLARKGRDCIVQGGLSAVMEDVEATLIERNCSIPPRELNCLALDHLHQQIQPFVVNRRDDLPGNIFLIYVGKREAHIVSPHMSIVYLSHEMLMRAPLRLFNTLDAQLPYYCGDNPYVPVPEDGMAYIELSASDKKFRPTGGYTLDQFVAHFWVMVYCNRDFLRYFALTTRLAFTEGYIPPWAPMGIAEIEARKTGLRSAISERYGFVRDLLPEQWRVDPLDKLMMEAA